MSLRINDTALILTQLPHMASLISMIGSEMGGLSYSHTPKTLHQYAPQN